MTTSIFILYSKKTSPSGRTLSKQLIEKCPKDCVIHYGPLSSLSKTVDRTGRYPDYIVNVGEFKAEVSARRKPIGNPVVLNHPESVKKSSNKRSARIAFRENNIPAPELWERDYSDIPSSKYPVVGRTTHHTKAKGFWFCKNKQEARAAQNNGATHFLRFIPNTAEYRLHIIASKCGDNRVANDYVSIKMSEKVFSGAKKKSTTDIIKNHSNGWTFVVPKEESRPGLFKEMRRAAKEAVALFNLDWGAVDIMYDKKNDKIYVLEINSSPCLTDATANTLSKYSEWVMHLCGINKKDVSKYEAKPVQVPKPQPRKIVSNNTKDLQLLRELVKRVGIVR